MHVVSQLCVEHEKRLASLSCMLGCCPAQHSIAAACAAPRTALSPRSSLPVLCYGWASPSTWAHQGRAGCAATRLNVPIRGGLARVQRRLITAETSTPVRARLAAALTSGRHLPTSLSCSAGLGAAPGAALTGFHAFCTAFRFHRNSLTSGSHTPAAAAAAKMLWKLTAQSVRARRLHAPALAEGE